MRLIVEGPPNGAPNVGLSVSRCKLAFGKIVSEITGERIKVVSAGSRAEAAKYFVERIVRNEQCALLIDSEKPWLETQDVRKDLEAHYRNLPWGKVPKESPCFLMVQCMESWILIGIDTTITDLRARTLEGISPKDARRQLKKVEPSYKKGAKSFDLLAECQLASLRQSPSFRQFEDGMKKALKIP